LHALHEVQSVHGLGFKQLQRVFFWGYLGSFWVRFFKIINNDGQSLASFFGKNIFNHEWTPMHTKSEAGLATS
jgi:hypothetical protein